MKLLVRRKDKPDVEVDLSPGGIHDFEWATWKELSVSDQQTCVDHLRKRIHPELLEAVKHAAWEHGENWMNKIFPDLELYSFHMMDGMHIRNVLREVVKDNVIPTGNWDDAYVPPLEIAAGVAFDKDVI